MKFEPSAFTFGPDPRKPDVYVLRTKSNEVLLTPEVGKKLMRSLMLWLESPKGAA